MISAISMYDFAAASMKTIGLFVGITFVLLYFIVGWLLFKKCGRDGWLYLIPGINLIVLCDILNQKRFILYEIILTILFGMIYLQAKDINNQSEIWIILFAIMLFIYIVANITLYVRSSIQLGVMFGKSDSFIIGLIFLPFIFKIAIAFDGSKYNPDLILKTKELEELDPLTKEEIIKEEGITQSNLKEELLGYQDHLDNLDTDKTNRS